MVFEGLSNRYSQKGVGCGDVFTGSLGLGHLEGPPTSIVTLERVG